MKKKPSHIDDRYIVYNDGRIYSTVWKRFVGCKDRYIRIVISGKRYPAHILVATLFVPNPRKLKFINHKNGNKWDNRSSNLQWCTQQENIAHSWRTGLSKPSSNQLNGMCKLSNRTVSRIRKIVATTNLPQWKIAEMFSISQQHVSQIKTGSRRS